MYVKIGYTVVKQLSMCWIIIMINTELRIFSKRENKWLEHRAKYGDTREKTRHVWKAFRDVKHLSSWKSIFFFFAFYRTSFKIQIAWLFKGQDLNISGIKSYFPHSFTYLMEPYTYTLNILTFQFDFCWILCFMIFVSNYQNKLLLYPVGTNKIIN